MLKFKNNIQNTCNNVEIVNVVPGAWCCCVSVAVRGNASSSATPVGE